MPPPERSSDVTISFPYSITIQIETTAPDVAQILLDGGAGPIDVTLPEANVAYPVAMVTVVTHSGDPWTVPLVLGGDDGAAFALTNGGIAPCDLVVGGEDIVGGSYAITISAPPA